MFSTIVLVSVLSLVSAYSKCNTADVKGPIIIPINKVLVTSPIQVSGNIEIVDGCTFKVTGFSLTNASPTRWYGGIGSASDAVTLAEDVVRTSGEQTFTFRNVAGSEVSFRDFTQFRLFEESSGTLIATAQVPNSITSNLGSQTSGASIVTTGTSTQTRIVANVPSTSTTSKRMTVPTQNPSSSAGTIANEMIGVLILAFVL